MRQDAGACAPSRREWWEKLFVEHHAGVFATCRAILRHHEEAEDAAQEVFARVPADPAVIADTRRWLLEVARNVCIDILRYHSRRPAAALDAGREHAAPYDLQLAVTQRLLVDWVLGQLPSREGAVLTRQVLLDESLDTVARSLGVSYAVAGKLAAQGKRRAAAIAALSDADSRNESRPAASSSLAVHGMRSRGTCGVDLERRCAAA